MTRRPTAPRSPRSRRGMTLVEVVVALLILTGVLLVLGAFSANFAQANSQSGLVISANEIAATRLDEVRIIPRYDLIDGMASGTRGDTVRMASAVFLRSTAVKREGGDHVRDTMDYKIVTVTVSHPAMRRAVSKTTVVAAF